MGMATCLRPSTRVYSLRLRRFLSAMEHLMLQGIFPTDFAHPEVVEMLAQKATMAKDMAGNAFSTTVLQANLLALLVNSAAWRVIRVRNEGPPSSPGTKRGAEELEPDTEQTPPPKNALFTPLRESSAAGVVCQNISSSSSAPTCSNGSRPSPSSSSAKTSAGNPPVAKGRRAVPVPGGLGFVQMKWRGWNRKSATLCLATKVNRSGRG